MSTRAKLVILELISGLLGWVWLVAGAAAVFFAGAALFSDGSWSRFFWALAASAIAKWLAKGFHDNKIRVAYIANLMALGMSREEASKDWLDRYMGNKS